MKSKKTPKKKGNKDGFSLANLISIIGLVVLGFFLYLGMAYGGTNNGTSVLLAVGVTLFFGLMLYFMLYAKQVETNFTPWRIVEYILLAVFVVAACVSIPTMCHFINVNSKSAELMKVGNNELDAMEKAINDFKNKEKSNLSNLKVQLQTIASQPNYISATSDDLKDFIKKEIMAGKDGRPTQGHINSFNEKWEGYIENLHNYNDGKNYAKTFKDNIKMNRDRIQSWQILEIPKAIEELDKLKGDMNKVLDEISSSYPLHQIGREYSGRFDIKEKHESVHVSSGMNEQLKPGVNSNFKAECANLTGMNGSGIFLSIIIFLLVIFSYISAYRSNKVSIKGGVSRNDQGRILKV